MVGGSPHRRSRAGLWFAGFIVASLLMLLASRTEPALLVQQATARALNPVRSAIAGVGQGIAGVIGAIGEIDRLRSENDQLRSELAGAQQRIAELTEAAGENASLRQLLGLTTSLHMDLLPVRIISRDPSNFTWEVGIDAGTDAGVRVGMPVVGSADGAGGLAGTVVATTGDTATVRLVVDPRSTVIALDQETRALGLVTGQLGGQLVLSQVPVNEHLAVGDSVVSAGLTFAEPGGGVARSPYPKGLLLGRIQAIEPDSNGLTQTAFVTPAIDFRSTERLLVALQFDQQ
ncbi:MAG: rod shape-determining protein MreC [Chloroflexi bacterium]|nr:MAG: rod shape-determining protein MreC [Chloroflexota bacterium]